MLCWHHNLVFLDLFLYVLFFCIMCTFIRAGLTGSCDSVLTLLKSLLAPIAPGGTAGYWGCWPELPCTRPPLAHLPPLF